MGVDPGRHAFSSGPLPRRSLRRCQTRNSGFPPRGPTASPRMPESSPSRSGLLLLGDHSHWRSKDARDSRRVFHTSLDFCTGARDAREFSHSKSGLSSLGSFAAPRMPGSFLALQPGLPNMFESTTDPLTIGSFFLKNGHGQPGIFWFDIGSLEAHARQVPTSILK